MVEAYQFKAFIQKSSKKILPDGRAFEENFLLIGGDDLKEVNKAFNEQDTKMKGGK